jgi:hypothetical protein
LLPDPAQTGVAPEQALSHLPQWEAEVSWTQEPLQRVNAAPHSKVHALLTHTGVALARLVEQALPHAMQLSGSLVRSTQDPLHGVEPAGQTVRHS